MEIFFTVESKETLYSIVAFVREQWGEKTAEKFKASVIKTLRHIRNFPEMYKASLIDPRMRHGHITDHTSVVYEIADEKIILLYFWDNRQQPILGE